MIVGAIYSIFHLVLGVLAALWTYRRLSRSRYGDDGCLIFAAAIAAFIFWPLALAILIALWMFRFASGED